VLKNQLSSALCSLLPLAFLWWRLVDHLRLEWTVNPQYAYGWAVPFLCAYLLWQRLRNAAGGGLRTEDGRQRADEGGRTTDFGLPGSRFQLSGFRFQLFQWSRSP